MKVSDLLTILAEIEGDLELDHTEVRVEVDCRRIFGNYPSTGFLQWGINKASHIPLDRCFILSVGLSEPGEQE